MTREEAAALLEVSVTAEPRHVARRYQELCSDYQVRLTNAPTTTLKRVYQDRLRDLEDALKLLQDPTRDFPGTGPRASEPLPMRRIVDRPPPIVDPSHWGRTLRLSAIVAIVVILIVVVTVQVVRA